MTIRAALDTGRLATLDAVLWVRESTIAAGAATGTRAIDVHPWRGIGCRIYPDRARMRYRFFPTWEKMRSLSFRGRRVKVGS